MVETSTFTIAAPDGSESEVTLPPGLLEQIVGGDRSDAEALGDVVSLAVAQHAHGTVHHAHGEPDDELLELESAMMELFEARFGRSFGEVTGHSH